MRKPIYILAIMIFFQSCAFIINEWSDGKYSVSSYHGGANSLDLNLDIGGVYLGRVSNIIAIGSNDIYIIVKNKDDEYSILNKLKDDEFSNAEDIVQGPYSFEKFIKRKRELGIEDLHFTKEF